MRVAVLVSGGGTNLQALLDAKASGKLPDAEFVCVISSREGVRALERAGSAGVPARALPRKQYPDNAAYSRALLDCLGEYQAELVVLAGFLCILSPEFCARFPGRIVNVHPSLIPSFCGDGMYGLKVHEAALRYGVKVTGATVHLVNEVTDGGAILLQKAVEVLDGDTPETLQKRVMEQAEWELLPRAVDMLCREWDAKGEVD